MPVTIPESVFTKYYDVIDSTFTIFGVTCQLVYIEKVEEISTDDAIPGQTVQRVRITCREIILKKDKDASGKEETTFEYFPQQEEQIKDSNSTSSWYLLADYRKSNWPKEGIFYWTWKASDGIRWEEA